MQESYHTEVEAYGPKRMIRWSAKILLGSLLMITLISCLGSFFRVAELMCHFRVQYAISAVVLLAVLAVLKQWRWVTVALLVTVLNSWQIAPFYFSSTAAPPQNGKGTIKVVTANLYSGNIDHNRAVQMLLREEPDVFVCLEVTAKWMDALDKLRDKYPYRIAEPRSDDNFGIALFSRLPLNENDSAIVSMDKYETPAIRAKVETDSGPVTIWAAHPIPPLAGFRERNEYMSILTALTKKQSGPIIVMGDLNMTMWSPFYKEFVGKTGLRDSRLGFGVLPTWPSGAFHMRIPIDHCLVSPGIGVTECYVGEDIGSDHLPLVAKLILPQREAATSPKPHKTSAETPEKETQPSS